MERKRRKKKNNAKFSGHYVYPRTETVRAHALRSHQYTLYHAEIMLLLSGWVELEFVIWIVQVLNNGDIPKMVLEGGGVVRINIIKPICNQI